jgi:hypothetical protein
VRGDPNWYFWLIGIGLTLLLEAPFVLWLLRPTEQGLGRRWLLLLVANLVTHPLVWFFFPSLPLPRLTTLLLSEGWAIGAETVVYALLVTSLPQLRWDRWRRALLVSVVANGASWGVGTFIVRQWRHVLF